MPDYRCRPADAWPSRRHLDQVRVFHGLQRRHRGNLLTSLTDLISTANNCNPVQEFRHNQFYKLHVQEKNERGQQGSTASPSSNRGSNRGFRQGSDAKAIFVGGLPVTVTEDQLRDIFNPYGNILDCKVIRKSLVGKFLVRRFSYIH
jgi:hypothetical protein